MSELRVARKVRVFGAMDAVGLDVLVLGRRDSVAYATGARSLWTAGTRPFGAAAVLVAATGATHLLSTWDEGVPEDVPFDHLYGVTWNPAIMASALGAIPGLAGARRIGTDTLSPGFRRAAGRIAPDATVVPADDVLHTVRARKLPEEVELIRAAVAVARRGADAAAGGDRAALHRALAAEGVTVPSSEPMVQRVGERVQVDVGVLVDGYEGGCGRTYPEDDDDPAAELVDRLRAAARPGATGRDIRAVAGPGQWMVRGTGMGFEPPVITPNVGADATIAEGMTLSIEAQVGDHHHRDLAVVL